MAENSKNLGRQKAAKIAGMIFALIIITNIISMIFDPSSIHVEGDDIVTLQNIKENIHLYRIDAAYELIMYVSVVVLSYALYVVLKPVDENFALFALLARLVEAILGCLSVLVTLLLLLLVDGDKAQQIFGAEQLSGIVSLLLSAKWILVPIIWVFLALGSITFCVLFYRSRYIPRFISVFGIISYASAVVGAFLFILASFPMWMLLGMGAMLFELTIGLWLLIRGVKLPDTSGDI